MLWVRGGEHLGTQKRVKSVLDRVVRKGSDDEVRDKIRL